MQVIFHPLAEREMNEAAAYYSEASPGLGERFLAEVQRSVRLLAAKPHSARPDADIRWWSVRGFPYSVIYHARPTDVRILAIAHQKRRPFYWTERR